MTHLITRYSVSSKFHISLCPYCRAQLEMKMKKTEIKET